MPDGKVPSPERFGEFYEELHPERTPYRWHERAAQELANGRAWNKDGRIWEALSAPTGAGKTTLIECFLFALACTGGQQSLPRRLFWVVDRRNVVDQVFEHALSVVQRIAEAEDGLLAAVRERLESLGVHAELDEVVQVRLWRGGLAAEPPVTSPSGVSSAQAPLSPVAPAVVCSTVDQVGSRLLFRGYGISHRSRPIEAALVGTNSLIVLDEAHLASAFQTTVTAVANIQKETPMHTHRVQMVAVTATHSGPAPPHAFELTDAEREDPALARRRAAERQVTLIPTRSPVAASVKAARELADEGRQVIGVVANTVGNARQIAKSLRPHGDMLLIIGPARPLDRERLLKQIPKRNAREHLEQPLFIVGTQTLEVGLDLDFDALVTECAPLSSLVQRFGRLDRAGDLSAEKGVAHGAIVEPVKPYPVYGETTAKAWQYLRERAEARPLQFSTEGVADLIANAQRDACEIDSPCPPQLLPFHMDLLVQTSHNPEPDPYVAAFLRGEQAHEPADVQICWRADLTQETPAAWPRRVEARLPHPGELLSLPLRSAKWWLAHRGEQHTLEDAARNVADIEGMAAEMEEPSLQGETPTLIRVPPPNDDGDVKPQQISLSELRSGDVIVLPSSLGGCDEYGWDPSSRRPVSDLGNLSRSRPRLLLSSKLGAPPDLLDVVAEVLQLMAREEISEEDAYEELYGQTISWLASGDQIAPQTPVDLVQKWLAGSLSPKGKAIRLLGATEEASTDIVLVPQEARQQGLSAAVTYQAHIEKVQERVDAFAASLGVPDELSSTLKTAARHHDLGKLDRRFQAWLNGGSAADPDRPLAKSARGPGMPGSWIARREADWPRFKRHEATSAALLAMAGSWPPTVDRELLLYLVSTHHGDGRPFRWHVPDPEPVLVTAEIDGETVNVWSDAEIPWLEHADRFIRLNEHFGEWGLAAIESLLVLADRTVSAEGS